MKTSREIASGAMCALLVFVTAACGAEASESLASLKVGAPGLRSALRTSAQAAQRVDLLLVIDNSATMAPKQQRLVAQLPRLIAALTDSGSQADSLHVGVVTSELGVMRERANVRGLEECLDDASNDDGLLQAGIGRAPEPACGDVSPALDYLTFEAADRTEEERADDRARLAHELGCIASVGVQGCGMEQQLEAMLKALAPSTQSDFIGRSAHGHGAPDGRNSDFIRDDATLVVLQVTDEDDCSIQESGRELIETPYLFGEETDSRWSNVGYNLRCGQAVAEGHVGLQPIARYIEGLRNLKPGRWERVVFAGIVGIPESLEEDVARGEFGNVLAHPDMQFVVPTVDEFSAPASLPQPSCWAAGSTTVDERGFPARRFVEFAERFGANARLFSICSQDYADAVDWIAERVAAAR